MKMLSRFSIMCLLFIILLFAGLTSCNGGVNTAVQTTATPAADVDTVRQALISNQWEMSQIRINLNSSIPVLLKLNPGDRVDGFYFLEKGNNIDFQIAGKSVIYQSISQSPGSANISSDRFSFIASDAQGIAYTLTFTPAEKGSNKATPVVFLELIYPKAGEIFYPMGTK